MSEVCRKRGWQQLSSVSLPRNGPVLPDGLNSANNFLADFVGNEQETHRNTIDTVVAERPLREIYLRPFEIIVREASPWGIMSSYNRVNGIHADMNEHTLKDILRGEWGYDG